MTYNMWVALVDGPDPETKSMMGPKPPCPKLVGEWFLTQESQITGDERTAKKNVLEFKCELSIPKCRWNFLRSQTIDQMGADEASEGENSDYSTLDFNEMIECICRCATDKYRLCMEQWLPSHNCYMFTMADCVRAFIQNMLFEKVEEVCMYEKTVIKAERFDAAKFAKPLPDQPDVEWKLFRECWKRMPLMDLHHFPLWEKGVHDCLQKHFGPLQRVFAHYTKGISGIDSAADALEMELEEFHDFVKESKLETKMVNFTTMTIMFAKVCCPALTSSARPSSAQSPQPLTSRSPHLAHRRMRPTRRRPLSSGKRSAATRSCRRTRRPTLARRTTPSR